MRIGIYDPYLDDLGGGEKYMMSIAECLSSQHNVSVFWDNRDHLSLIAKRFSLQLDKVRIVPNIFTPKVGLLQRLKESHKYDAIIVLSDGSIPLTLSKKLFLHIQQPLTAVSGSSVMEQFKLARVHTIFYNSQYTQKYNKTIFPRVSDAILYPPVTIHTVHTEKENVILHVGRYRQIKSAEGDYKKQEFMIETFKKMVDSGLKSWKFIIAAGVRDQDRLAFDMLQEASKGYPIEFHLNVSNKELFTIYNKAKIYWHASGYNEDLDMHPELAEHFGISTVEAMGSGAVPVVLNAGGQREIITDTVDGLFWKTQKEFMEKTQSLITDKKQLEKLSHAAKIRSKDFTKEMFCKKMHDILLK